MTITLAAVNGPEFHPAALLALILFTVASLGLGAAANVVSRKGLFLRNYYLGNRSLGPLAIALTAAVMSGGTFMGFPSLVYSFGWVVSLWICSYMVFGLTVLGVLGKRVGQLARRTGAITLPDLLRERYSSPLLGILSGLVAMSFLTCFLIPQFKAGALIVKLVLPDAAWSWAAGWLPPGIDPAYLVGLVVFTLTVVAYTTYGGFLAAVWTDIFQSVVMAIGVLILLPLALIKAGGLAAGTLAGIAQTDLGFAFGPGANRPFLPITLAISMFFLWAITGMAQPSTVVRLMAFRDSRVLRHSIVWLTFYNLIVYVPIILTFIAARAVLPGLSIEESDEVMPRMVLELVNPYLAGLILAAPYGAVMSTVSAFLLIVSSGLVRDVYQRFLHPTASERLIARLSYVTTMLVGLGVALAALRPPHYLQVVVMFAAAGLGAAFFTPLLLGAFWRRANGWGALAGMITGVGVTIGLYVIGLITGDPDSPPPYGTGTWPWPFFLLGFDPCVWGLSSSLLAGIVVSLATSKPDPAKVALLFDRMPSNAPAPASLDLHPELAATLLHENPSGDTSAPTQPRSP
ncbi:SSS sodium solute transporter superfamily [Isosphaera pallida ATCC 43644]|uniref:SSS sodium solute transporter superfamily n=1 Tax=Isosphaera pallida (strain ATCC 43644 / DSM 9630 / IS1B) TaxID=575540 RepID=E8QXA6_ISOPI|nr:sodium/solute symporter [Isosphaera pallida]ADV61947.1 SSS sodium solute transporter superfamily [Isosphaera pallida ATCC 43644]